MCRGILSRFRGRGRLGSLQAKALDAREDSVARDAEAHRGLRDVPARLHEDLEQVRAHLLA